MFNFLKNKTKIFRSHRDSGFSLIEMLVYVGIMGLFLVVLVNSALVMGKAYQKTRSERLLNSSATSILTKMSVEIEKSASVDATSILENTQGKLVLNQPLISGSEQVEFSVNSGELLMKRAGANFGSLSSEDVFVDEITFYKVDNFGKQAVKVELTLTADVGSEIKSEKFYVTSVLRRSY